jgi:hypothetical protein
LIARKLINNKTNKEPTGRLLIPDLITGSKLNNQPTPEQAGVQRVLKTRTDNRLLLGRYLIFKKITAGSGYFQPPKNRRFSREPSFPVISNPLKKPLGFRKELAIFWAVI